MSYYKGNSDYILGGGGGNYSEGSQILEQISQRSCGISLHANTQNSTLQGSKQPAKKAGMEQSLKKEWIIQA